MRCSARITPVARTRARATCCCASPARSASTSSAPARCSIPTSSRAEVRERERFWQERGINGGAGGGDRRQAPDLRRPAARGVRAGAAADRGRGLAAAFKGTSGRNDPSRFRPRPGRRRRDKVGGCRCHRSGSRSVPNRPLLIALACLALPGLALAAKWEKVGEAGPVQVYRRQGKHPQERHRGPRQPRMALVAADRRAGCRARRASTGSSARCRSRTAATAPTRSPKAPAMPTTAASTRSRATSTTSCRCPTASRPARSVRDLVVTYVCTTPVAAPPAKK